MNASTYELQGKILSLIYQLLLMQFKLQPKEIKLLYLLFCLIPPESISKAIEGKCHCNVTLLKGNESLWITNEYNFIKIK